MQLILIWCCVFIFLFSCVNKNVALVRVSGAAQGTSYHISYYSPDSTNYQHEIDSLLKALDTSLSTYLPVSIISRMNRNDSTAIADNHFTKVFNRSLEVAEMTEGLFDFTVAPIVNAWGFGFTSKAQLSDVKIDSLLNDIGYKKIMLKEGKLIKKNPRMLIDFSAIAQGYSVDQLAALLESKNISSYLVELGGEVLAKGRKTNNEDWKIGIDQPRESTNSPETYQAVLKLNNKAMATSGNYLRYYEENGRKYAHIIDPRTGYPAKHNLLSATVLADDCMTADAFATAFMVMGMENAKKFLANNQSLGLQVFLVYDDNGRFKTYYSEGLKEAISESN